MTYAQRLEAQLNTAKAVEKHYSSKPVYDWKQEANQKRAIR